MTWKIVITDSDFGGSETEQDAFGATGHVNLCQVTTSDELIAACQSADGLLVQWASITEEVLRALPRLKAIVRFGVGLDNIDLDAARDAGVSVSNVADYCVDEVALHALGMILSSARRISDFSSPEAHLSWSSDTVSAPLPPDEDAIGLLGLGRIGRRVAELGKGLGFAIHAYDPFPTEVPDYVTMHDHPEGLAKAVNHLSLHVPSTPQTREVCGINVLQELGPSGHLVNTSRGALVDESALLAALDTGNVRWASLDVFAQEPPTSGPSRALYLHPKVTSTPHIAYLSVRSKIRLRSFAASKLRSLLEDWQSNTSGPADKGGNQ